MAFKFLLSIFSALIIFFIPETVFAGNPPQQSLPSDGSTTSSSKLEWQAPPYALYSGNNYRVQVDDDSSFSSLNKDYYTDNTYYSPSLSDNLWYWRVKAKDSTGTWSDWSSVWSFTLTSSTPTPTPSPIPSPTTSPTASSTSTPSSSSSTNSTSSFTISDTLSQINSTDSFEVSVDLKLANSPNATFYLKGAFVKDGSTNYFGYTDVEGAWVKNSASFSSQKQITTDSSGVWSGSLKVKVDSEDSGYQGSGEYIFKVGRYTESGSGPTWSNEVNISIIDQATPEPSTAQGNSSTVVIKSPIPSPSIVTTLPKPTSNLSSSLNKSQTKDLQSGTESSVSGVATFSSQLTSEQPKMEVNSSKWVYLGGGIITLLLGIGLFIWYRKKSLL